MEFTSYELVATNTSSLNTGSYLNRTEYSLFVRGFATDLWYGLSANDVIELSIWDRETNFLGWNVINQSKSYTTTTLTYLNALNFPVTFSYAELDQEFILHKHDGILVNPAEEVSASFNYPSGSYFLDYNFTREMAGNPKSPLVIKEISPSRKELKLIPLNESTVTYNAFCRKKVVVSEVSPLYLEATKTCLYDQIYGKISPYYQEQINTIKGIFFLQTDGAMVNFLRNLYEDYYHYSSIIKSNSTETTTTFESLVRIQGIKTYFSNYLLSNSNSEVEFADMDARFNSAVSASIERKFVAVGKNPAKIYVEAKQFIYDFFTKYFYQPISDILAQTYREKYFSYFRNALNLGDNRLLLVLNHGMMDERISPTDPLTLLLKLKDPLPSDISEKTECWVSNVSLTPYVLSAIIKQTSADKVCKIGPPNFSLKLPDVSFTNTNTSYTAEDLQHDSEDDREITVSKNIAELSVDYTDFQNFVVFSSAELRLKIFKNKIINLTGLSSSVGTLNSKNTSYLAASGSTYPYYAKEYASLQSQMDEIVDSFDGYESYLYRTGYFSYVNGGFVSSSYVAELDESASYYDKDNRDSLINNCPQHILTNSDNDDYIIFLSMVGHFFDEIYEYISSMPSEKTVGNSATEEFTRRVVDYMLQTFGWNLDDSLEQATLLNNYLTSDQVAELASMSAEDRLKVIRNRVLINLPQIYKTKGTEEAIRLVLACYGIPSSLLSIREYGGVNNNDDAAAYTTYERAYMYQFVTGSAYEIFYNNLTQNAKTFMFKFCMEDAELYKPHHNVSFMGVIGGGTAALYPSGSGTWAVGFVRRDKPNMGEIWFRMGYQANPAFYIYSGEFPLFDGNVYSVMLRRNEPDSHYDYSSNPDAVPCDYDLYVQRNEFGRRVVYLTQSYTSYDPIVNSRFNQGASGSYLVRGNWFKNDYNGGFGIHGAFDKLQVWYDPITDSNFEDYVNSINSYAFSGSRPSYQSLLFRQHTDYPFDLRQFPPNTPIPILGTLVDWGGLWKNANPYYETGSQIKQNDAFGIYTAANMDWQVVLGPRTGTQKLVQDENGCWSSQSCYPYQFKVIDYPSTLPVNKYGPNKFRNEKIRHLSQSVEARFDINARSTYTSPNSIASDSNQLGLFVDPQDFRNKDIVRYYGNLDLLDIIGSPTNQYSSNYESLSYLRKQYVTALNESSGSTTLFNELITLYKLYFNRSVFESIKNLVPARTNTLTGILIEPTILERPRYQIRPIASEVNTGSVSYFDVTASHYFRDPNTKLLELSMSMDNMIKSTRLDTSYINLPIRDYPVNYGGNCVGDVSDKYSIGHFVDGITDKNNTDLAFPAIANFVANPLTVLVGSSVQFTNLSQNSNTYLWTFGDSTPVDSTANPVHTYNVAGDHTVTLTANSIWGSTDVETKVAYISVTRPTSFNPADITVDFDATPKSGAPQLTVVFKNNSVGPTSYIWNFGDGTTSTEENPTHIYSSAGTYTVTLSGIYMTYIKSTVKNAYISVTGLTKGGEGGCLLPGTQIRMADDTLKNIEDVIVGDVLYGTNGVPVVVKELLPNRFHKYNILNGHIKITYEHPVLVIRNGVEQLVQVMNLVIGDRMVKYDNSTEELVTNVEIFEETPTYNFVVDGDHMYVAENILVHNTSRYEPVYKKL